MCVCVCVRVCLVCVWMRYWILRTMKYSMVCFFRTRQKLQPVRSQGNVSSLNHVMNGAVCVYVCDCVRMHRVWVRHRRQLLTSGCKSPVISSRNGKLRTRLAYAKQVVRGEQCIRGQPQRVGGGGGRQQEGCCSRRRPPPPPPWQPSLPAPQHHLGPPLRPWPAHSALGRARPRWLREGAWKAAWPALAHLLCVREGRGRE